VLSMTVFSGSPFICGFYCSLINESYLWMIMEIEEGSLRDVLRWKFPRGFNESDELVVARVLFETLQGLAFLHDFGMIHRDVKAGNILFDSTASIKLADFGVTAIVSKQDSLRTTMVGTWHWMAPEVIDHTAKGGYDSLADIWSLGITSIELAYGDAPYGDAAPMQVVVFTCSATPPTLMSPKTPNFTEPKKFTSNFQDFVSCCLKVEPHKRGTTKKLLTHKFFSPVSKERSPNVKKALMDGLPSAGDRFLKEQEIAKGRMLEAMRKGSQQQKIPTPAAKAAARNVPQPQPAAVPTPKPNSRPPNRAEWSDDEILDL